MQTTNWIRLVVGLVVLGGLTLAQSVVPVPEDSMLRRALFDAGHVLLFGVVALLALFAVQSSVAWTGRRRLLGYAAALVVVVGLGVGTEFLQTFFARDAGIGDLGRDLLGGSAALLAALAVDRRTWGPPFVVRGALVVVAALLVVVGMAETARVWQDYQHRDAAFPSLASFDDPWELRFVLGQQLALSRVDAPAGWDAARGRVGRADFTPASYPGLWLSEPFPDWTGYDALEFEVRADTPVRVYLRVHDLRHDQRYDDRFNRALDLQPGDHHIRIPLEEVAAGPRSRSLELTRIAGIAVFVEEVPSPFTLWFDGFRLTRTGP